jgi:type IV pilus assembly protein PilA
MKKIPRNSCLSKLNSFTLVELLVVIGIIAILAAVLLSTVGGILNKAKLAKAQNTATQIQTAALAYYNEYSVYPVTSGITTDVLITDASASASAWGNLIEALCGNTSPYSPTTTVSPNIPNTRAIAFLNLKASDVDANNAPLNSLAPSSANPYFNIVINSSYSGVMGTNAPTNVMPNFSTATTSSLPLTGTSTAGVAVWANCNGTTARTNPAFFAHTY